MPRSDGEIADLVSTAGFPEEAEPVPVPLPDDIAAQCTGLANTRSPSFWSKERKTESRQRQRDSRAQEGPESRQRQRDSRAQRVVAGKSSAPRLPCQQQQ